MSGMQQETKHKVRLTSGEMASLWTAYMNFSLSRCVLSHFLNRCEDMEIKAVLEYGLSLNQRHLGSITAIFKQENFPLPTGFTNADVRPDAPRLFSDSFYLYYLKGMGTVGLVGYSGSLHMIARSDVFAFFKDCIASSTELVDRSRQVLLSKGLYIRPPYISTPEKVEFIQEESFLAGIVGQKRPLTAIEITHLTMNHQNNALGRVLMTGFSQVAQKKEVREYAFRGKEIAKKHIEVFDSILVKDDLPAPTTWDSDATESTESPFSDKLIMFHTTGLIASGIGNYGIATAASARPDVVAAYSRLTGEIAQYAKDGAELMIRNGWLEQPPQAEDRKALARV